MRHFISCCIVVKNEEKKIKACLDAIGILADEIVIVDTGSTDHTLDFISIWTKIHNAQNGVKVIKTDNKFYDEEGDFNFGEAKNFAFQNATKDFVMWLDASDTVSDQKKVKQIFLQKTHENPKRYFVLPTALSKNFAFNRARIGPREYASMEGRIHETMCFKVELERVFIPHIIKNFKKRRDLNRNLKILLKEWNKEPTARTCFYIGNTYRENGDLKNSLIWFRKRVSDFNFDGDFKEEHFKALECIAEILTNENMIDVDYEELLSVSQNMIKKEPSRVEGHFYLAQYYIKKTEWNKAGNELLVCKKCKKPTFYKLWLNKNIYDGELIQRGLEACMTGIKYSKVLIPESVEDFDPLGNQSTYRRGNQQYF